MNGNGCRPKMIGVIRSCDAICMMVLLMHWKQFNFLSVEQSPSTQEIDEMYQVGSEIELRGTTIPTSVFHP